MYMGRTVVVGCPLPADYKIDARIMSTLALWDKDEKVELFFAPTPFPTLGRDKIVQYAKYRVPNPTHILFLDSDVLPRRNTLERLRNLNKDIVMGVYPISQNGVMKWSVSRDDEFLCVPIDELPRNPFKVKSGGFGVCLVKFEVFKKLEWPYWKNVLVEGDIEMGEDIYFCKKAREAGFDIWCDPLVKCNHVRMANYLNIVNNILKGQKR